MTLLAADDLVLARDVLPALFPGDAPESAPELVLLVGATGAGRLRAVHRAVSEPRTAVAVLSVEALRPFHPDYRVSLTSNANGQDSAVAETVAGWLQATLRHAREHRRSLVVDGLTSPDLAIAVADQYARSGFTCRVVAVASPPSNALLAAASFHAAASSPRRSAGLVTRAEHETEVADVSDVLVAAAGASAVTGVTVFDDRGQTVYDGSDARAVQVAFDAASRRRLSGLESAQWLGELRRVTEYVLSRRQPQADLVAALIDLHEVAFADVTPALPVPAGSEVIAVQEHRLTLNLTALRRAASSLAADITGPVVGTDPATDRWLGR